MPWNARLSRTTELGVPAEKFEVGDYVQDPLGGVHRIDSITRDGDNNVVFDNIGWFSPDEELIRIRYQGR